MTFDKCCIMTMVCFLHMEYERTIRARNTNSRIPSGLHRIFTCNEHEHPFGDMQAQVGTNQLQEDTS